MSADVARSWRGPQLQMMESEKITLDRDQLREVTLGDPELMREFVTALIDDTTQKIPLIQTAIQEQNGERCSRLAHYCKGACANLGAVFAADLLQTIELRAAARDFYRCSQSLAALAAEIVKLQEESSSLGEP
jgi:HPt (histidine-containing phosphotransfer) domain-containing protein